jgi:hypothetical protein
VIDGQQRLLSVVKFYHGTFKNAGLQRAREFKLTIGRIPFAGKLLNACPHFSYDGY